MVFDTRKLKLTTVSCKRAFTYLAITFAFSWSVVTVAWLNGARTIGDAASANQMFTWGPPIAALICVFLFHKHERLDQLGLRMRLNRWLPIAAIVAIGMVVYSQGIGKIFPSLATSEIGNVQANAALLTQRNEADLPSGSLGASAILIFAALGFSLMFTLTEELGWRGYFYRQWRNLGFWQFSVIQGVIWGVWHWPLVFYFGMVFAEDRLLGLLFYPLMTTVASPVATLLRDRSGSIWAPGIWHGTNNAIGILLLGELFTKTQPNFLALLANLPLLLLIEWFRRRFPDPSPS